MTTLLARSIQSLWANSSASPAIRRAGRRAKRATGSLMENLESRLLLSYTAGHLDPSFNLANPAGFGKASGVLANSTFGTMVAEVESAAMLANGKILVAGITDVTGIQMVDTSAIPVPLVDTFGNPQYATQLTVARFNADGTLDTSFGTLGYVNFHTPDTLAPDGVTPIATVDSFDNNCIVVQADGRIVIVGSVGFADSTGGTADAGGVANFTSDFLVVRLNADGSLDDGTGADSTPSDSFSGNNNSVVTYGYTTTDYAEGFEVGRAATLQSDGKILVTGYTQVSRLNPESFFFTTRYNTDGSLDTSFGEYGHALTSIGIVSPLGYGTQARSIMLQPDGKIVVGGQARMPYSRTSVVGLVQSPWDTSFVVARYNLDGSLDTTFGQTTASPAASAPVTYPATPGVQWVEANWFWRPNGYAFTFDEGRDYVSAMSMDANNSIYIAGYTYSGDFASARLTSSGAIDQSWGGNRGLHTTVNVSSDTATDITVQADGRVIVSGISTMGADGQAENVGMVRYNADSTIDTFFGTNGRVSTNSTGAFSDIPRVLLPTPDGKFVIITDSFNTLAVAPATAPVYDVLTNGLGSVGISQGPAGIGIFRYLNDQISADDVRPLPELRNAANTDRAPDVTIAGGSTYNFSVVLTDNVAIAVGSLGLAGNTGDIYVTGPNSFNQAAVFDSVDNNNDGQPRLAHFHFATPGGSWDLADTGIYTILLRENAIWDTANNSMPAGPLGQFTVSLFPDVVKPTAVAAGPDVIAAGAATYTFQVTYGDNIGVDLNTLGNANILVTGPNNFSQLAALVSVDQQVNGTPRVATYRITPPTGAWLATDQGNYRIFMQPNQVGDTAVRPGILPVAIPNFVNSGQIGSFVFAIPDTTAPTATIAAPDVVATGGHTYTFTVSFADNTAISVASISSANVTVTGPGGYSHAATFVSVDAVSDGTPRTVTYTVPAPGGTWDLGDAGTFNVTMNASQVPDLAGNFVAAGSLGTFKTAFPVDLVQPTAVATLPGNVTTSIPYYQFTVSYSDNNAILVSSLGAADISLVTPAGVTLSVVLVSVSSATDTTPVVATYRLLPPGGAFDSNFSGNYSILLSANQVTDTSLNAASSGVLGTFNVNMPDTVPPIAIGTAPTISSPTYNAQTLTVVFVDQSGVDVSTIGGSNIYVTGPHGFNQNATFVSVNNAADGSPRTATFTINSPTGGWYSAVNGTYSIHLRANQVADTLAQSDSTERTVGTFTINVPVIPPSATAPNITTATTNAETITVQFVDFPGIVVGTLGNNNIYVTGPKGYNQNAGFVSVNNATNGTPRTAVYTVNGPGGSWDGAVNGTYSIHLRANQILDINGNSASSDQIIGSFTVNAVDGPPDATMAFNDFSGARTGWHYFDLTFHDNSGIATASFTNASAIQVVGPDGRVYSSAYVANSLVTNGANSARTATFGILPTGLVWDDRAAGAYQVFVVGGKVADINGRFMPRQNIGTFYFSPSTYFSERYYVDQYSDIANAIQTGMFTSGWAHYQTKGQFEHRNPSPFYNDNLYLALNTDVATAVANHQVASGWAHYLSYGQFENRVASGYFDPQFYLGHNTDVKASVDSGAIPSALQHFLSFGLLEGRDPSPLVSNLWYLTHYSDALSAVQSGLYHSGLEHFFAVSVANNLDRSPSAFFDRTYYLANNTDVAQALTAGTIHSALEHFLTTGIYEQRKSSANFDMDFYNAAYPAVQAAVLAGQVSSPLYHYVRYGQFQGYNPSATFDEVYYITNNLDVKAVVDAGLLDSGYEHYLIYGRFEGRLPHA